MRERRIARQAATVVALVPILLSVAVASASAASQVRFLHAVPGAPEAQLVVESDRVPSVELGNAGFGRNTDYRRIPAGAVDLTLSGGGDRLARSSERLEDGSRYTVVAVPEDGGAMLRVYRDGEATTNGARWRMVHVASEIAAARVTLDGGSVGTIDRGEATEYSVVDPGTHRVALRRPDGGDPLVDLPDAELVAGTAQTVYAVGSGGEPTRMVVLQDDVATPSAAPDTGFGGLARQDGGTPWLAALAAALLAGTLGGFAHLRRGHGRA